MVDPLIAAGSLRSAATWNCAAHPRDELICSDGRAVQAFFAGAGINCVYLYAKVGGIVTNNT